MATRTQSGWVRILAGIVVAVPLIIAVSAWQGYGQEQGDILRGAELYAAQCGRCHHPRPPSERSNREWAVVIAHMRVRANLAGDEANDILAFLTAQNRAYFAPAPVVKETLVIIQKIMVPQAPAISAATPDSTRLSSLPTEPAPAIAKRTAVKPPAVVKKTPKPPAKESQAVLIKRGQTIVKNKVCAACHIVGKKGGKLGPKLTGVMQRIGREGILKKLENPRYNNPGSIMPPMNLTLKQRLAVVAYLATLR